MSLETWGLALSAIEAGNAIIDERKRESIIRKMNLLLRDKRKIVVFGISGAGKSQFLNSLGKKLNIPERTLTNEKIRYDLDKFPIQFIDTPGHNERPLERKKIIKRILKDKVEGIINVVSFGYEENQTSNIENILTPEKLVKESFLKQNKASEIERLSEWLSLISPSDINWIINLVNKADIWWNIKDNVGNYYANGEYFSAFNSIACYSTVLTIPYCSIIKPFYNTRNSGLFGEIEKEKLIDFLLNQLLNLINE
jgi:hypothetical protein